MSKKRYKDIDFETVRYVFLKNFGNVSATCKALGIDRTTFYNWKKDFPEFNQSISDAEESNIDFAEAKLLEAIGEGNLQAVIFFLKTKGKKRGYVERVEQEVSANPFIDLMKSLPSLDGEDEEED